MALQGQHAEHGGVAGRADGHGLGRGEGRRQGHQPVAVEAGLLGQAAPVALAHAPAIEHHGIAHLPVGVAADLDGARQVDARHHGEFAHHGRLAGDGQAVLVIQRGRCHAHGHVALGQSAVVDVFQRRTVAVLVFLDEDALEHVRLLQWPRGRRRTQHTAPRTAPAGLAGFLCGKPFVQAQKALDSDSTRPVLPPSLPEAVVK